MKRDYDGLPRWLRGKEFVCQCRRGRCDPWVGKIPRRRKWQPTAGFLPGKFHRQTSLEGYHPQSQRTGHTETVTEIKIFSSWKQERD